MKKIVVLCLLLSLWGIQANPLAAVKQEKAPAAVHAFGAGLNICQAPLQPVVLSNPTTVTNCTRAGVQAALDQGGHINFACGAEPVTIAIDQKLMTNGTDTVLDGGGLVTFDGLNSVKILEKPYTTAPNTLTIQNMRFINGRAPNSDDLAESSGAAITLGHPGTRLHIFNSTFENNVTTNQTLSDNQGGAIFAHNMFETVIVNSVFRHNTAGNGGAYGQIASGLLIYNSLFEENQAADSTQGGIVRGYGGAINVDGLFNDYNPNSNNTLEICGSHFVGNTAVRGGGATATVISDNFNSKFEVRYSTFTENSVSGLNGQFGQGGAIYHIEDDHAAGIGEDNLEISHSTFHGNTAGRQGGAVWLYLLGQGQFFNNTLESNRTTAGFNQVGQGGAMAVNLGLITIFNSTFANNHADYQGGALMVGGQSNQLSVTLANTIFLDNTLNIGQTQPSETEWQGFHTNRPLVDGGQNIQQPRLKPTYNNEVNNNITANPLYVNPLLLPLADYGGYNLTMALQEGSPAINQGNGSCPAVDQRNAPRVGACDIGAYEFGGTPPEANSLRFDVRLTDLNGTLPYTNTVGVVVELENLDPAVVEGVNITTTLPAGLQFGGWVAQNGATVNGQEITVTNFDSPAGVTSQWIFTATITAPAETTLTVAGEYETAGGDAGADSASFTVGQPIEWLLFLPLLRR